MPAPPPKDQKIDMKAAAAMTERHRRQVTPPGSRGAHEGELGGMFAKDAILSLLEQEGARYLRFYHGRNEKGGRELILVAADEEGNDIEAIAIDGHWPCPPFCPETTSMLRG